MHPCVALLWLPFVTASGALAAAPNDEHGADHPPPVEAVVFRDALSDGLPGPYMVIIPAGEFLMGDPYAGSNRNSAPPHAVRIRRAFAMGRFEVTFAEYDRFAVAAGFPRPDDAGTGRGERPVMNVTWDEAAAYTMWLSEQTGVHYHLPSESQWEYAAAAGARTRYSFGDDVGRICRHANVGDASAFRKYAYFTWSAPCDDGFADSAPVGSYPANAFGLHDMHGNVWEWVQDCWHEDYAGAPADEFPWLGAECGSRVVRGGSWFDGSAEQLLRLRYGNFHTLRLSDVGFRVARDL